MTTISTATTISLPSRATVRELREALEGLPDSGKISVTNVGPDRPGVDAGYTRITVTH